MKANDKKIDGRGRPAGYSPLGGPVRKIRVSTHLNEYEKSALNDLCEMSGRSPSSLIREALLNMHYNPPEWLLKGNGKEPEGGA
jgi:hypothetical protein